MKRRTFNKAIAKGIATAGLAAFLSTTSWAADTIKIGAVWPKTGPLAGGATVTQGPNIEMWVKQVNARGGLKLKDGQKMIELIEYDDKTNPGEHIKAVQRLATQDKVDFIIAPYGTGFNIAAAPIYAKYGYPQIAVSAISDKIEELTARYPNLFFTLGTTTAFVEGVRDILVDMRDAGKRLATRLQWSMLLMPSASNWLTPPGQSLPRPDWKSSMTNPIRSEPLTCHRS